MDAAGAAATVTVAGVTGNGAYRLPAAVFDFYKFRPIFGTTQGDDRIITYFLSS